MYTIFTVDVEGHVGSDPVDRLIYGRTRDDRLCGIDMLMDILDRYRVKGLFFVDIAEAWDYGEEKIAGVLRHIKARGHDVGVHIHPDHMADRKRLFLSEYSRDEQYKIISKCTEFYHQVLGEGPLAFRAGKYGADRTTLDILAELDYKVDFSQFYGQKWCHIRPPVAKNNVQRLENGLIEIPVTTYVSLELGGCSRHDKLDCGQSYSEFKTLMHELERNNKELAVLFAHSFSLINWRRTPDAPSFAGNQKRKLEQQLEYINANPAMKKIDVQEAIRIFREKTLDGIEDESVVVLKGLRPYYWFAGRAWTVLKSRFDIKYRKV